ncbi:uncharacterized protein LOC125008388 [Mugil cephalus]|uniref:uncharacterized protein LOC125008388 n=1 Tax=Mugil cephalus TaxID=48193 RepID=UPI001FB78122|nr:uncharacterized protein LOC125008388 [Mugil cephalus]
MIRGLAALILLSILSLMETNKASHQISLTVAELGDNLTLTCSVGSEPGLLFWHKQSFGYVTETIVSGSFGKIKMEEPFNNSRIKVTKVSDVYYLTITNVSKEDEATYFCQAGSPYNMRFISGTLVAVKDPKNQQKSVYVKQSPNKESVQIGGSVTLQCSLVSRNQVKVPQCPDNHSVYWFRAGAESYPSIIYTQGNSSHDQGQRKCVYRLSKTISDASDAGTYYCAVVTCGEILLGEGTKVETEQQCLLVIVFGALLGCSLLVNIALIIKRRKKPVCGHCKGRVTASNHAEQDGSNEGQTSNGNGEEVELNYVALDFPSRKSKRWKEKKELQEECLYSSMRDKS